MANGKAPAISVVLPVYNGEKYIEEAVESILNQSFNDFELIILDDGSVDRTQEIVGKYQLADSRIRLISRENRGLIATLNEGLELARGKYIARMDADDISHHERLKKQYDFLEANESIGVLGCGIQIISQDGSLGTIYHFPEKHDLICWAMFFICPLAHPSVMMRREIMISVGSYRWEAIHAEDYDLWYRLSKITRLANLPDTLLKLRKHDSNITEQEGGEHLLNSARVSASCISECTGHVINESLAACLMKSRIREQAEAINVQNLLLELFEKYKVDNALTNRIIKRDTAVRLSLLALKSNIGIYRLRFLYKATCIDPFWLLSLSKRFISRHTGVGVQYLVG